MIPGLCPDCGSARPLPDYLADAQARAALAAALDCPAPLAHLIVPYLALHAPAAKRIQMTKLTRLLRTLADLINTGAVVHKRETLPAPLAAWQRGLEDVLANRDAGLLTLPLEGHGYLCGIVYNQQRQSGQRTVAASRPTHASHRPFGAGAAEPDAGADARADKQSLLSQRHALLRLMQAPGCSPALGAQLSQLDARLRGLGVQLAPAPGATDADTDPETED